MTIGSAIIGPLIAAAKQTAYEVRTG